MYFLPGGRNLGHGLLDDLGVPWLIGGSLASSLHGIPRSTQDVDLVADLRGVHVAAFTAALQDRFYVDAQAVMGAVKRCASCNLIHLDSMTKVDVFVAKADPLSRGEMSRRQYFEIEQGVHLPLASAEDIVLQKLAWFRKGGGVSERQWRDVLGVIRVRANDLDLTYLREAAAGEGLTVLLDEALAVAAAT